MLSGFLLFGNLLFCNFLSEVPLSAHTPQALITGRYPLQSGLSTPDSEFKPDLAFNFIELTLR